MKKIPLKDKKALIIIPQRGFYDEEYQKIRSGLEKFGVEVKVASTDSSEAVGSFNTEVLPDFTLEAVIVDDFDCVIFIGGEGTVELFDDQVCSQICWSAYEKGDVIAAIGEGSIVLANTGILKNKRATTHSDETDQFGVNRLQAMGAIYVGDALEQAGKIITASSAHFSDDMVEKIIETMD